MLDHVILGCSELNAGVTFVTERTGVRPVLGGVHPDKGTQNALLSLGERRYLELLAPDPAQTPRAEVQELQALRAPALVGWAVHPDNIEKLAASLKAQGIDAVGPQPGSRKRPDGRTLSWKALALSDDAYGLLPFFIEWDAASTHPAIDAPKGCHLELFEACTPNPPAFQKRADQLGLDLPIAQAKLPHLHAVIAGPRGLLDVTSGKQRPAV
jgi:Glyoxalase-like domain